MLLYFILTILNTETSNKSAEKYQVVATKKDYHRIFQLEDYLSDELEMILMQFSIIVQNTPILCYFMSLTNFQTTSHDFCHFFDRYDDSFLDDFMISNETIAQNILDYLLHKLNQLDVTLNEYITIMDQCYGYFLKKDYKMCHSEISNLMMIAGNLKGYYLALYIKLLKIDMERLNRLKYSSKFLYEFSWIVLVMHGFVSYVHNNDLVIY